MDLNLLKIYNFLSLVIHIFNFLSVSSLPGYFYSNNYENNEVDDSSYLVILSDNLNNNELTDDVYDKYNDTYKVTLEMDNKDDVEPDYFLDNLVYSPVIEITAISYIDNSNNFTKNFFDKNLNVVSKNSTKTTLNDDNYDIIKNLPKIVEENLNKELKTNGLLEVYDNMKNFQPKTNNITLKLIFDLLNSIIQQNNSNSEQILNETNLNTSTSTQILNYTKLLTNLTSNYNTSTYNEPSFKTSTISSFQNAVTYPINTSSQSIIKSDNDLKNESNRFYKTTTPDVSTASVTTSIKNVLTNVLTYKEESTKLKQSNVVGGGDAEDNKISFVHEPSDADILLKKRNILSLPTDMFIDKAIQKSNTIPSILEYIIPVAISAAIGFLIGFICKMFCCKCSLPCK